MKWEYRIGTVQGGADDQGVADFLTEQGNEEWELVGFDRVGTADEDGEPVLPLATRFIFTRPEAETAPEPSLPKRIY